MNVVLLLVVQRVLFALISVAVVNVMFTALQPTCKARGRSVGLCTASGCEAERLCGG